MVAKKRNTSPSAARIIDPRSVVDPTSETIPFSRHLYNEIDKVSEQLFALSELVRLISVHAGEAAIIEPLLTPLSYRLEELTDQMRRELPQEEAS